MAEKTGLPQITIKLASLQRTQVAYSAKIDAALSARVSAGVITSAEKATVDTFLASVSAAITVLHKASGY